MKRGDVILVRFPHPSGQRGKKTGWVLQSAKQLVIEASLRPRGQPTKGTD